MSLYSYKFYLDDIEFNPDFPESTSKKFDREDGRVFFRETLNGALTVLRGDFRKIWAVDLDHEFTLRIERKELKLNGVYRPYIKGKFYKTDCNIDEDKKIAEINIESIDRYDKLLKSIDREFDLVKELMPPIYKVRYRKEPLLQVVFPYHGVMYNRIGDISYLTELVSTYIDTDLLGFGFVKTYEWPRVYIPGTNDMSPDVSGIYQYDDPDGTYTRLDGVYIIEPTGGPPGGFWSIKEVGSPNIVRYISADTPPEDFPLDATSPFLASQTFTSVANSDTCACFPLNPYQRILTDATTSGGFPTIALPQPDIDDITFNYKYRVDIEGAAVVPPLIIPTDAHTNVPNQFGTFATDSLHFAGEYFGPNTVIPSSFKGDVLMQPNWRDYSLTIIIEIALQTILRAATTTKTLKNAYRLLDVFKSITNKIDPDIDFQYDSAYSQFFLTDPEPVNGDDNAFIHFITPKTNITIGDYNNAASSAKITFGNVDELMKNGPYAEWYIDNNGMLHLEHDLYYKNGLSYTTQIIGSDLTTQTDPHTLQKWAYHTKKYGAKKIILPEFINFGWMDQTSPYFDGSPIKPLSGFVQKGNTEDRKITRFTSDLGYALANPEAINKDGFFILATTFDGTNYDVEFNDFDADIFSNVVLQNGFWSFYYLHEKFHRFNLPSPNVNINKVDTTATTTRRAKDQDFSMPSPIEPDPMRLMQTSIGVVEVTNMEINLTTRENKIKVLGDLDFTNPG